MSLRAGLVMLGLPLSAAGTPPLPALRLRAHPEGPASAHPPELAAAFHTSDGHTASLVCTRLITELVKSLVWSCPPRSAVRTPS